MAPTDSDRMGEMWAKYQELRNGGQPAHRIRMILDSSNVDVDAANRAAQRDRLARREISPHAVTVDDGERRWELRDNDQVLLLGAIRADERFIKNGVTGTVMRVDERECRIRLDDEFDSKTGNRLEVTVPTSSKIGLAYAVHIAKYQGGEVEHALITPGRGTNSEQMYSMLTRGIVESHIFGSVESHGSVENLGKMTQRSDLSKSATKSMQELRAPENRRDLAPVRSDEIQLDDIRLDPMPPLEPVLLGNERIEQPMIEPRMLQQSLIQDQELDMGRDISGGM